MRNNHPAVQPVFCSFFLSSFPSLYNSLTCLIDFEPAQTIRLTPVAVREPLPSPFLFRVSIRFLLSSGIIRRFEYPRKVMRRSSLSGGPIGSTVGCAVLIPFDQQAEYGFLHHFRCVIPRKITAQAFDGKAEIPGIRLLLFRHDGKDGIFRQFFVG